MVGPIFSLDLIDSAVLSIVGRVPPKWIWRPRAVPSGFGLVPGPARLLSRSSASCQLASGRNDCSLSSLCIVATFVVALGSLVLVGALAPRVRPLTGRLGRDLLCWGVACE